MTPGGPASASHSSASFATHRSPKTTAAQPAARVVATNLKMKATLAAAVTTAHSPVLFTSGLVRSRPASSSVPSRQTTLPLQPRQIYGPPPTAGMSSRVTASRSLSLMDVTSSRPAVATAPTLDRRHSSITGVKKQLTAVKASSSMLPMSSANQQQDAPVSLTQAATQPLYEVEREREERRMEGCPAKHVFSHGCLFVSSFFVFLVVHADC